MLEAVRRRKDCGTPPPTYRELLAEFGWTSTGTVRDHLRALARKGYLELSEGRSRDLRLLEERAPSAQVPLLGRIAAGTPLPTEGERERMIPVPSEWVRNGKCFAVCVSGDSMKDAGILDGDQVVVRAQPVATDGDIVVATLNGETTLKRLKWRGSRWYLMPENKRYRPIPFRGESAIVQGVMVGLLRSERQNKPGIRYRLETNETRGEQE